MYAAAGHAGVLRRLLAAPPRRSIHVTAFKSFGACCLASRVLRPSSMMLGGLIGAGSIRGLATTSSPGGHSSAACDAASAFATTSSGLQYRDEVVGRGECPVQGSYVKVHYTGTLQDGTQFDSSRGRGPLEFQVGIGQVIRGWDEGIMGMKVGGKRQLIIPAALGYGARGAGGAIPPNAVLLFDCELVAMSDAPPGVLGKLRALFGM